MKKVDTNIRLPLTHTTLHPPKKQLGKKQKTVPELITGIHKLGRETGYTVQGIF